jgi:2-haloacid dehalogenase
VVDWRSSVIRQCEEFGAKHGVSTDWETFTDEWRYDGYMAGIGKVMRGEIPFQTADSLHRRKLAELVEQRGMTGISDADLDELNLAWHRLDPWPDSVAGLERLRGKFVVSTLSNGNVSLLVDMARYAGLRWDCVLAADITGAFKPQPECYLAGARILGLEPAEVMMVAAHKRDLEAAQAVGLQAAFIPRPLEAGPNREVDLEPNPAFQYVAKDFHDLADQLGCD